MSNMTPELKALYLKAAKRWPELLDGEGVPPFDAWLSRLVRADEARELHLLHQPNYQSLEEALLRAMLALRVQP